MLTLFLDKSPVSIKQWMFPAGEAGIRIEGAIWKAEKSYNIVLQWEGNQDLFALAQLVDAIRQEDNTSPINLTIPYFPYSRQDRRCFVGEGHALKVVGNFINQLGFNKVITYDAHSYVLEACVDRLVNIPQHILATNLPRFSTIIAPDAGASKKIYEHTQVKSGTNVVVASKKRDSNGKIIETIIDKTQIIGEDVCVVDDLCDGGATFLELAKVLQEAGVDSMSLYVTHGIFSKGVDTLLKYYDNIYVSNLMNQSVKQLVKEI